MSKKIIKYLFAFVAIFSIVACSVKYSFTGASIAPEIKTVSILPFTNIAPMVAPILAPTITSELQDKFSRSTSLVPLDKGGDMAFTGVITNYTSTPTAVTSNEYASQNRLTITVKVKFTNKFQPKMSFDKSFSAYLDYDNTQLLQQVEGTLIPDIVDQIVEDIFNASASNW
ncbi:MAG: LptE family protein [Bacteroidetes bacterium]|nr:LptE family protein [Bacteroidota bacterium]